MRLGMNFYLLFLLCAYSVSHPSERQILVLTGFDLTLQDVVRMSQEPINVAIDSQALSRVHQSHKVLLQAGKEGKAIYGLNRGVGLDKDKTIFNGDTLDPQSKKASENFNKNIVYSHCAAVEPELSEEIIFPVMLIRLNMMMQGRSGVHPDVVILLAEFINKRIAPIVPGRGSIGEGDITILSHISLAMMGEGDVIFEHQRRPAKDVLALCGLEPIEPFAKDALSILSSNAYSCALAVLTLIKTEQLLKKADIIFALSLEGLNGNIAPLLPQVQTLQSANGQHVIAHNILDGLEGSYVWKSSAARALQDPLSFRCVSHVHGAVYDILQRLREKMTVQINTADDNPRVILDVANTESLSEQERLYYLNDALAAVIPTACFEPINWVIDYESLAILLSHVSHLSIQRMLKLDDERFTGLSRFLSPNAQTIGFAALQMAFIALDTEIRSLSVPHSADFFPVTGEIEDHATHAPFIVQRVSKIIDNLYYIFGLELMHAAQAVDLRREKKGDITLGNATNKLYAAYRMRVPFLCLDRPLSYDIGVSRKFVNEYVCNAIKKSHGRDHDSFDSQNLKCVVLSGDACSL